MNFIELSKTDSEAVHINSMLISSLEVEGKNTKVHLMGGGSFHVRETISSIKEKIEKSESIKFRTYQPNPERK
jgi:uncharacterized protein YlzI (FlbEa/FlbD family)